MDNGESSCRRFLQGAGAREECQPDGSRPYSAPHLQRDDPTQQAAPKVG